MSLLCLFVAAARPDDFAAPSTANGEPGTTANAGRAFCLDSSALGPAWLRCSLAAIMWRYWFVVPAVFGFAFMLIAHAAFIMRLHRAHPQLWARYWQVFPTFSNEERKTALHTEVYGKIDDKTTLRFLTFQRISWVAYVAGIVISIFALMASLPNGIL